ncbi:hypothetical protein MHBO_002469 [Bonamia ostreae]|uniref:Uncharacterized protein n=1 Tax=Bonamia ostreae TaxID=126728 RepID=A0ABV2AN80_9EUKA
MQNPVMRLKMAEEKVGKDRDNGRKTLNGGSADLSSKEGNIHRKTKSAFSSENGRPHKKIENPFCRQLQNKKIFEQKSKIHVKPKSQNKTKKTIKNSQTSTKTASKKGQSSFLRKSAKSKIFVQNNREIDKKAKSLKNFVGNSQNLLKASQNLQKSTSSDKFEIFVSKSLLRRPLTPDAKHFFCKFMKDLRWEAIQPCRVVDFSADAAGTKRLRSVCSRSEKRFSVETAARVFLEIELQMDGDVADLMERRWAEKIYSMFCLNKAHVLSAEQREKMPHEAFLETRFRNLYFRRTLLAAERILEKEKGLRLSRKAVFAVNLLEMLWQMGLRHREISTQSVKKISFFMWIANEAIKYRK